MTHITPTNPDHVVAGLRPLPGTLPRYDFGALAVDPQVHIEPTGIEVAADRLGLHIEPDGTGYLTVHHPAQRGPVATLLSLDDEAGRAAALAVLPLACADAARGHWGTVRLTLAPTGERLVILSAVYVSALGVEVTA